MFYFCQVALTPFSTFHRWGMARGVTASLTEGLSQPREQENNPEVATPLARMLQTSDLVLTRWGGPATSQVVTSTCGLRKDISNVSFKKQIIEVFLGEEEANKTILEAGTFLLFICKSSLSWHGLITPGHSQKAKAFTDPTKW